MIPMLAHLHVETPRHRIRLWLPLFLIWLLLLPLVLVLLPLAAVACLVLRLNPFTAIGTVFSVLAALSGTRVEVERPGAMVFIDIV
jgi:hypothetical protein